jgi:hypothetical protein
MMMGFVDLVGESWGDEREKYFEDAEVKTLSLVTRPHDEVCLGVIEKGVCQPCLKRRRGHDGRGIWVGVNKYGHCRSKGLGVGC